MEITKFIHTKKSFLLNLKIKKNKKNSKLKWLSIHTILKPKSNKYLFVLSRRFSPLPAEFSIRLWEKNQERTSTSCSQ
jgi:hypothetical protein